MVEGFWALFIPEYHGKSGALCLAKSHSALYQHVGAPMKKAMITPLHRSIFGFPVQSVQSSLAHPFPSRPLAVFEEFYNESKFIQVWRLFEYIHLANTEYYVLGPSPAC